MYKISVITHFSAAHHLLDYEGKCENIHGHNWKVKVTAGFRELAENGIAYDFKDLKHAAGKVIDELDHTDLNTHEYFAKNNPTSENIARSIFERIKDQGIPALEVTVWETENYSATYTDG
jgi:6-pyruvoyltetrahydropterin/6-carboxytetrahydropterin synthase